MKSSIQRVYFYFTLEGEIEQRIHTCFCFERLRLHMLPPNVDFALSKPVGGLKSDLKEDLKSPNNSHLHKK